MFSDILAVTTGVCAIGRSVEAWDAAKHSRMHRISPSAANYPAPEVRSAKVKGP